ncbi:hypothetical protein MBLNU230_g0957t1 [Neophaeotheca triangularis]
MDSIEDLAKRWLSVDHDTDTRQEIQSLVDHGNTAELEKCLRKRIAFGTAGLRARMRGGFAFMNSLTVLQASQGIADVLLAQQGRGPKPSVVVGYDGRYNSEKFARLAAAAFLTKGLRVMWFGRLVHTPMVPFAVGNASLSAGVMVTASHNPKHDNGYKVYWGNGCQIIPPLDTQIAAAIDRVEDVVSWDIDLVDREDSDVIRQTETTLDAYFASIKGMRGFSHEWSDSAASSGFVYTPMHGVGLPFMQKVVEMAGLAGQMHVVDAQARPDPEFPTVPFPNPEEKGALNLAIAEADAHGCDIVLANDPDADRFAAAQRLSASTWHQFTGNQIGYLLASHVLDSTDSHSRHRQVMLASTVSSRMLASMARTEGFIFKETLTGFKWLGNVAQDLSERGLHPTYAYEEAIGYMFPEVVWDKDGIAAAAAFVSALKRWKSQGLTPWTKLQQLYEKYGYFEDANTYLISPSPAHTDAFFTELRVKNNGSHPTHLGDGEILRWRDLTVGYDSAMPDHKPDLPVDPKAQMITCELRDVVFTARGSGTEPKLKLYIEGKGGSSAEAQRLADTTLELLLQEWFLPKYGLSLAGS